MHVKTSQQSPLFRNFEIVAVPLLAVVLFAGLGIAAILPPSPQAEEGNAAVFSVDRAMAHVQHIAREPHPVGSKAHDPALEYLVEQLRALPLDVEIQSASRGSLQLTNVLARPRNASGSNVVLLVAHYDSVPTGPGAADDAAGVATLLETARLLAAEPSAKNEVAFLFTDGEELGMLGASAFIKSNGEFLKHVRVVLNFEARGNHGPVVMFETGPHNLELMRRLRGCPYPVATSFAQDVYHRMPNNTDLTRFMAAGLTGYNFAVIMGLEAYHGAGDTWENLDRRSVAHYGSYATTLSRRLAQADLDSLVSNQDGIFFPLFRGVLVVYPESWAVPLAAGACIFYGIVIIIGLARRRFKITGILLGTVFAICIPAIMALIVVCGMKLLKALFNYQQHGLFLVSPHSGAIAIFALAIAAVLVLAVKFRLSRKFGSAEMLAGALLVWLVLAVITALRMHGFSYLFLWPALFGTAALWIISGCAPSCIFSANAAMICSLAPGCVLFSPVILLVYHALTIGLLPVLVGLASHLIFLVYINDASVHEGAIRRS
ncbi:MAG: hypothetical protein JWQ04_1210 [Pedosphaera sp.]|nr:hypothetical protein [Pedosphaera sp.]